MRRHRMTGLAICVAALLLLLGGAAPAQAEILYGTDGAATGPATNLYILNPANGGVVSTVGPVGFRVSGLAFHPQTGVLYGATAGRGTSSPRSLITINLSTGAGTLIGSFGLPSGTIADISFDGSGILYGWSGVAAGSDLYTINLATGAATLVADSGAFVPGAGLAFSPGGILFLSDSESGPLYTVNPATGIPTQVATLTGGPLPGGMVTGLAFDENGTLFGADFAGGFGGGAFLVTINTATGAITNRGATVAGLDAIAFQPTGGPTPGVVPEPATLALFGASFFGLLAWRYRARIP